MAHITDPNKVGGLALGIEFEVSAFDSYENRPEMARYETAVNQLAGWKAGYDCGFQEIRSSPVTPLRWAKDRVFKLLDLLEELFPNAVYGDQQHRGMHVHINVEDSGYPSLDIAALFDTYMASYQDEANRLVDSEVRRQGQAYQVGNVYGHNHTRIPAGLVWDDIVQKRTRVKLGGKAWDFSPRIFSEWPTVELRVWNTTKDRELIAARFDMLERMARDTVALMHERGTTKLVLQPNSWARLNPDVAARKWNSKRKVMA